MSFQISRLARWQVTFEDNSIKNISEIDSSIMALPVEIKEEKMKLIIGQMKCTKKMIAASLETS